MCRGRTRPTVLLALLAGACSESDSRTSEAREPSTIVLDQRARATLTRIGSDSLTAAVRITGVFPEPDGEAIPVLFTDSTRGVSAGLALIDARAESPELLWPDSVTRVWWSGSHALTFTTATGQGAYVVVDVHQAAIDSVAIDAPLPPVGEDSTDRVGVGRAQQYVDSLHGQPAGNSEAGELRYTVTRWLADPTRQFAAFHVTARDPAGREVNPAWYITDLAANSITRVDQVVGPATELPAAAAGWTYDRRFIYAKGSSLHEVSVRREAPN